MNAIVSNPLQQPVSASTEFALLRFFVLQLLSRIQTSALVKVMAVHGGGLASAGTVDVLPLVGQVDGIGTVVPHATVYGLPFERLQGGSNAIICDPAVGDIGLVSFGSRDSSLAERSLQPSPPGSARQFDWADGFYVASVLNTTPTQYLQFVGDTIINLISPGTINVIGAQVNISSTGGNTMIDGVPFTPHFHIDSGGSGDGGPVGGP